MKKYFALLILLLFSTCSPGDRYIVNPHEGDMSFQISDGAGGMTEGMRIDFPSKDIVLETKNGQAHHAKTDIFRGIIWYTFDPVNMVNFIPVPIERVKEIIALNEKGKKADELIDPASVVEDKALDFHNVVGEDSLTRFDDQKRKKKKRPNKFKRNRNRNDNRSNKK